MQTVKTVRSFARSLTLSLLLNPRAVTALAAVIALAAGLLLGAADASAQGVIAGGSRGGG